MIDFDLAELYGVPTKRLNERVSRNKKRFPEDFMFRERGGRSFEVAICDLKRKQVTRESHLLIETDLNSITSLASRAAV